MVSTAIAAWILYVSAVFPSDAVLLDFCNEFVSESGTEYTEILGHLADAPDRYTIFVRQGEGRKSDRIASFVVAHLDTDRWLMYRPDMSGDWIEIKTKK